MPPDARVSMITATLLLVLIFAVMPSPNSVVVSLADEFLDEVKTSCSFLENEKEVELPLEVVAVSPGEVLNASSKSQRRRMVHNVGHSKCLTLTFPTFGIEGINIFRPKTCQSAHKSGVLEVFQGFKQMKGCKVCFGK